MLFSGRSSRPRDRTGVSYVPCIGRRILYHYPHLGKTDSSPSKNQLKHPWALSRQSDYLAWPLLRGRQMLLEYRESARTWPSRGQEERGHCSGQEMESGTMATCSSFHSLLCTEHRRPHVDSHAQTHTGHQPRKTGMKITQIHTHTHIVTRENLTCPLWSSSICCLKGHPRRALPHL